MHCLKENACHVWTTKTHILPDSIQTVSSPRANTYRYPLPSSPVLVRYIVLFYISVITCAQPSPCFTMP